jgi:hypothetical protein
MRRAFFVAYVQLHDTAFGNGLTIRGPVVGVSQFIFFFFHD